MLDKLKKILSFQIISMDDRKQKLRLRRFFMALAMYALYRADTALYDAKNKGRYHVECCE